jgi:hypothetical protein
MYMFYRVATALMKQVLRVGHVLFLLVLLLLPAMVHSQVRVQKGGAPSQQVAKDLQDLKADGAKVNSRISQVEGAVVLVQTKLNESDARLVTLSNDVNGFRKELGDTGLKAFDAALKVSNLKWQIAGITITVTFTALAVVLTVLGWGGQKWLRDLLKKDADEVIQAMKQMTQTSRFSIEASSMASIAYAFWVQHDQITDKSQSSLSEKVRNLEAALLLSDHALQSAGKLDETDPELEILLTNARSSYAYYLTDMIRLIDENPGTFSERGKTAQERGEREKALSLAATFWPIVNKHRSTAGGDKRWIEWKESYCWVLWSLGDQDQKQRAETLVGEVYREVREVYKDASAAEEMRDWIRKKYFQGLAPT